MMHFSLFSKQFILKILAGMFFTSSYLHVVIYILFVLFKHVCLYTFLDAIKISYRCHIISWYYEIINLWSKCCALFSTWVQYFPAKYGTSLKYWTLELKYSTAAKHCPLPTFHLLLWRGLIYYNCNILSPNALIFFDPIE